MEKAALEDGRELNRGSRSYKSTATPARLHPIRFTSTFTSGAVGCCCEAGRSVIVITVLCLQYLTQLGFNFRKLTFLEFLKNFFLFNFELSHQYNI